MKLNIVQRIKMNNNDIRNLQKGDPVKIINAVFPTGIIGTLMNNDWLNNVAEVRIADDMYVVTLFENLYFAD